MLTTYISKYIHYKILLTYLNGYKFNTIHCLKKVTKHFKSSILFCYSAHLSLLV